MNDEDSTPESNRDTTRADAADLNRANASNPEDPSPEDLPSVNEIVGTLLSDRSLWPLVVVMLGSLGAFGAALLVLAIGDHNPFAIGALVLILGMTTDTLIRARRRLELRNLAKLIALFWGVSIGLALIAVTSGIA